MRARRAVMFGIVVLAIGCGVEGAPQQSAPAVTVDFDPPTTDLLLVVDGNVLPYFTGDSTPAALAGRTIESARMYFGAEAVRRYGSRAAAGALVLTTRAP